MARGAPPIGLRPRRMTPSMSNAMPKDGLAAAGAECEKRWARSDGRRRCTVWSTARDRDRDRAARASAERKLLMLRRRKLQKPTARVLGLRPSASQRMRGLWPRAVRGREASLVACARGGGRVLD